MPSQPDSKSAKVRQFLAKGLPAGDIARQVGCTVGLVYNVKSHMGKPATQRRQLAAGSWTPQVLNQIVAVVQRSEQERLRLRATLEKIAQVIAQVL